MITCGIALVLLALFPSTTRAQSGGPRNYLNTPVYATSIFVNIVGTASGPASDSDLSLPVNESVARYVSGTILYSFPLGDKYGGLALSEGRATVDVTGPLLEAQTVGITDPSFTFHANIFGAAALKPELFHNYVPQSFSSFHLTVTVPLGSYDRNSAVNSGSNRWTVSPLLNLSLTPDKGVSWLDLYAGGQFYSDNGAYLGANRLAQRPLGTFTMYYSHNITKTIWAGIGVYYRTGGETFVNGVPGDNAARGFRPSAAISGKLGKIRLTLRYDNTSPAPNSRTSSGLINLQISPPPF
jgi:hypothetical protein